MGRAGGGERSPRLRRRVMLDEARSAGGGATPDHRRPWRRGPLGRGWTSPSCTTSCRARRARSRSRTRRAGTSARALSGELVHERTADNEEYYGIEGVSAQDILLGLVPRPRGGVAEELYTVLDNLAAEHLELGGKLRDAAWNGNVEAMKDLLAEGADVNAGTPFARGHGRAGHLSCARAGRESERRACAHRRWG